MLSVQEGVRDNVSSLSNPARTYEPGNQKRRGTRQCRTAAPACEAQAETHSRLQCWISNRHAERLQELSLHLEDSQASLIEQAIDLLYQHELVPGCAPSIRRWRPWSREETEHKKARYEFLVPGIGELAPCRAVR